MQDIFQSHKSEGAYVIHMGDDARRSGWGRYSLRDVGFWGKKWRFGGVTQ